MSHDLLKFLHDNVESIVPWSTIWNWIVTYGEPACVQVFNGLRQLLPAIVAGTLPVSAAIQWAEQAFAALAAGQPLPPLPVVGP